MTSLVEYHQQSGAVLAADGIPLHYGNLPAEYAAALHGVVLLDRSHEGRLALGGRDARALINRISTNQTLHLQPDRGCATVFTTSTARIIERAEVIQRESDTLLLTHPPRRTLLHDYLRGNLFFNDQAMLTDETEQTHAFALHGPQALSVVSTFVPEASTWALYQSAAITIGGITTRLIRRPALSDSHWLFITDRSLGTALYQTLLAAGSGYQMTPAGSLTYNVLRIRAGVPSLPELNDAYLPLELGLWDDINFHKGCYTGQEIIARMDSREKLARVLVRLHLSQFVQAPASLYLGGQEVGYLTSSVQSPDGEVFAMGVIKTAIATGGGQLRVGSAVAKIGELAGVQPPWLQTA